MAIDKQEGGLPIDPDKVRESMRSAIERVRKKFGNPSSSEPECEPEPERAGAEEQKSGQIEGER
jgi:hypothetical protein